MSTIVEGVVRVRVDLDVIQDRAFFQNRTVPECIEGLLAGLCRNVRNAVGVVSADYDVPPTPENEAVLRPTRV